MTKIYSLFLSLFLTSITFGQNIVGDWYGAINVQGIELPLVFHIQEAEGVYQATMDSPDQGVNDIPMGSVNFADRQLKMALDAAKLNIELALNEQENFEGNFIQSGMKLPLTLTRTKPDSKSKIKPQEPKPPFPYASEEVTFTNELEQINLAGTFTFPKKGKKFVAVVLISGSGPQDRNSAILGHKPFLLLADYLTRQGIAVLRFDDRGVGASTGDFSSATSKDFSQDVRAAVKYLQGRKEINAKKIGLIGHSEGGLIAPMVSADNPDIAFIVMMAGPGVHCAEVLLEQQKLNALVNGAPEADIKESLALSEALFKAINAESDHKKLRENLEAIISDKYDELYERGEEALPKKEYFTESLLTAYDNPWMLYFLRHDPKPYLQATSCPILAVNGEKDLQVEPKSNLKGIQAAMDEAGMKNYKIVELPGLNHLFQHSKTGSPSEYASLEETLAPEFLKLVADWINELYK